MNWELARNDGAQFHDHRHACHAHSRPYVISRRGFAGIAAGAAFSAGVWIPGLAEAKEKDEKEKEKKSSQPVPIRGGSPKLGGSFHVFGPTPGGSFDPIDAEPSTITDFNGFVGLAYISGTVQRTDKRTREVRTLPMISSDMRFMTGVFRGVDSRVHEGTLALV